MVSTEAAASRMASKPRFPMRAEAGDRPAEALDRGGQHHVEFHVAFEQRFGHHDVRPRGQRAEGEAGPDAVHASAIRSGDCVWSGATWMIPLKCRLAGGR
jgi:hypothetical protein